MVGRSIEIDDAQVKDLELWCHLNRINDVAFEVSLDLNLGEAPLQVDLGFPSTQISRLLLIRRLVDLLVLGEQFLEEEAELFESPQ